MELYFLYQITAVSRFGGYRSQIPVLCPLPSNEFAEPPRK